MSQEHEGSDKKERVKPAEHPTYNPWTDRYQQHTPDPAIGGENATGNSPEKVRAFKEKHTPKSKSS